MPQPLYDVFEVGAAIESNHFGALCLSMRSNGSVCHYIFSLHKTFLLNTFFIQLSNIEERVPTYHFILYVQK